MDGTEWLASGVERRHHPPARPTAGQNQLSRASGDDQPGGLMFRLAWLSRGRPVAAGCRAAGVRQSHPVALLIVVTGPPGAGKLTVARALASEFDRSALVEGEVFFAFIARGALAPWLPAFAAAAGVEHLHYAVLLPPARQCLERVASRTGHGFTDQHAARHMHDQFASSAIDPRHVLPNPAEEASKTAREILRRTRAGTLNYP